MQGKLPVTGRWHPALLLAGAALVMAQSAWADRLVDDDALRVLARLVVSPACATRCKDDRWTLLRLAPPRNMLRAGEAVYLATEDVQSTCGSAGCAGAYLLREDKRLVLLAEDFGLGQGRHGPTSPQRIPGPADRARLPSTPLAR